jgi:hypothetical protein
MKTEHNTAGDSSANHDNDDSSTFREFLLAEYNNIAQAHFNTTDSLASFIKHYIVIASIPFAAAVLLFNSEATQMGGVPDFDASRSQTRTLGGFLSPSRRR